MTGARALSNMPDWIPDAIFYQIFPDRFFNGDPSNDPPGIEPWGNPPTRDNFFGGDLQGIIDKLDYLQDLGITAIYLNPIFKAHTNHKYDTSDYLEVDPAFGTNALLNDLINELHGRGMRIILDGVFNHCGDGFWAFEDVKAKGQDSAYDEWFQIHSFPILSNPLTYQTCGGCWYLPKLNLANGATREYVLNVAAYWPREFGVDGWRLDSACRVPFEFWREFRNVVKSVDDECYLVGEIWRDSSPWIRGDTFDGATNYRLRELILAYCAQSTLDAEEFAFEVDLLLQHYGEAAEGMLNFLGCHDTPRVMTLFNGEVGRLEIAMIFLLTFPGAPLIYYGDEIGMKGENDPECRRTMIWDEDQWHTRIFDRYRALISLRKTHAALRRGRFEALLAFNRTLAYRRSYNGDEAVVILNPGPAVTDLTIPMSSDFREWFNPFNGEAFKAGKRCMTVGNVPAFSGFVLLPTPAAS